MWSRVDSDYFCT